MNPKMETGLCLSSKGDVALLLKEHAEMCCLLMQAVDAMRTHQRLYNLTDNQLLMLKCREIESWLDKHQ